jgi:hypothetical protein
MVALSSPPPLRPPRPSDKVPLNLLSNQPTITDPATNGGG